MELSGDDGCRAYLRYLLSLIRQSLKRGQQVVQVLKQAARPPARPPSPIIPIMHSTERIYCTEIAKIAEPSSQPAQRAAPRPVTEYARGG
jgi:hypothetical protein